MQNAEAREKNKPQKRLTALEITLLAVGSPLWGALLLGLLAVVLAVYLTAWAVIVSLWATFGALVGCGVGGVLSGIVVAIKSQWLTGLALVGMGFFSAGLGIFMFFACKLATRGLARLTLKIMLATKRKLTKQGAKKEVNDEQDN